MSNDEFSNLHSNKKLMYKVTGTNTIYTMRKYEMKSNRNKLKQKIDGGCHLNSSYALKTSSIQLANKNHDHAFKQ